MLTEDYILDIKRKLCNNQPLTANEITTILSALRESGHCLQTPYYEIIYHDEYDNQEHRIMEPVYHSESDLPSCKDTGESKYYVSQDKFELSFNRIVEKR